MYIAVWLKGTSNTIGPYITKDNDGYKAREFPDLAAAQKFIEQAIASNKMLNYDVVILDPDKHEVAAWAAALPPALEWNTALQASPTK